MTTRKDEETDRMKRSEVVCVAARFASCVAFSSSPVQSSRVQSSRVEEQQSKEQQMIGGVLTQPAFKLCFSCHSTVDVSFVWRCARFSAATKQAREAHASRHTVALGIVYCTLHHIQHRCNRSTLRHTLRSIGLRTHSPAFVSFRSRLCSIRQVRCRTELFHFECCLLDIR